MAIPKEITIKIVTNFESLRAQLGMMSSKLARAQHLMKELNGQLIEIENDLNDCDVTLSLVPVNTGGENVQQQQNMGG